MLFERLWMQFLVRANAVVRMQAARRCRAEHCETLLAGEI
jgi:hypothetical protein